jgi:hypothetical protein
MKYFFMFLGTCGAVMLIAVAVALFKGIPTEKREIVKPIEIAV